MQRLVIKDDKNELVKLSNEPLNDPSSADTNELFQIRFTKEVFASYEDYINQLNKYRKRIYSCSASDRKDLTLEAALVAEMKAKEYQYKLSFEVQKLALECTQFSYIGRFETLCDHVLAAVDKHFFPGDEVQIVSSGVFGSNRSRNMQSGKILREATVDDEALKAIEVRKLNYFNTAVEEVVPRQTRKSIGESGSSTPPPASDKVKNHALGSEMYYLVELAGTNEQVIYENSELKRPHLTITKALIRAFLKDAADKHQNIIWVVKENFAKDFEINPVPPRDIFDSETGKFRTKKERDDYLRDKSVFGQEPPTKRQKTHAAALTDDQKKLFQPKTLPKPKYPIEDTEVPHFSDKNNVAMLPAPKSDFGIDKSLIFDFLTVYSFLFSFGKVFRLSPFSIDDFRMALEYKSNDADQNNCPILDEIFVALFRVIANGAGHLINKALKNSHRPEFFINQLYQKQALRHSLLNGDVEDVEENEDDEDDGSAVNGGDSMVNGDQEESQANGSNEENSSASVENEQFIASEYSRYGGQWWKWRLKAVHWTPSLAAFLLHLGNLMNFPSIETILKNLIEKDVDIDPSSGKVYTKERVGIESKNEFLRANFYAKTSFNERLELLVGLIQDPILFHSKEFRKATDEAINLVNELKREKRELEKQRADLEKELSNIEIEEKAKEEAESSKSKKLSKSMDIEEDIEKGFEEENKLIAELKLKLEELESKGRGNRKEKLNIQSQIKEIEESKRKAQADITKAVIREKTSQKRKEGEKRRTVENELDKVIKRDDEIDYELRLNSGLILLKPLGRDRFWNKYWWFDGFGQGISNLVPFDTTKHAYSNIPYATGRIYVEGMGKQEFLGYCSSCYDDHLVVFKRKKPFTKDGTDPLINLPFGYNGVTPGTACGENPLEQGEWAFYDEPEQIDQLLEWLNEKGIRECALKSQIEKYYDQILFSFKKRSQKVESQKEEDDEIEPTSRTRVTRNNKSDVETEEKKSSFMRYTNIWANLK